MSGSWIEKFAAYRRSRFPAVIFVPLGFLLCLAGSDGLRIGARELAVKLALACGLLFQFRLWDDLSDRERDRLDHPDRVLVKTPSPALFRALLLLTFALNSVLIALQPAALSRAAVFLALTAGLLFWYRHLRAVCGGDLIHCHVILAKYPAFVYLVSSSETLEARLWVSMLLVYFSFCIYEFLHDRRLKTEPRAAWAIGFDLCVLGVVLNLLWRGGL